MNILFVSAFNFFIFLPHSFCFCFWIFDITKVKVMKHEISILRMLQAYQESQLSQSSEKVTKLEESQTELENEILHLRKEKLEADSMLKK